MYHEISPKFLGNTPVLFLDFDGPMHPFDVDHVLKKGPVLNTPNHKLFENMQILEEIVNQFPKLKIVLSTSWVRVLGYSRCRRRLSPALKARLIGATWHSAFKYHVDSSPYASGFGVDYFSRISRYDQIMQYVLRHGLTNWVALDDDDKNWNENWNDHLVKCDSMIGLSDADIQLKLIHSLEKICNN